MIELSHTSRRLGALAAFFGFLCVAGGAFGAHGLSGKIPDGDLAAFSTGMRYGLVHSLASLVCLLAARDLKASSIAALVFLIGVFLFSGSLAFLGLSGSRALVLLTPLGGLCFLIGWGLLIYGFLKGK